MRFIHETRNPRCRHPFGAQPTGAYVDLALWVEEPESAVQSVLLHYAFGVREFAESRAIMALGDCADGSPTAAGQPVFRDRLCMPSESCLLFYWFAVHLQNGRVFYVYADTSKPGQAAWGENTPDYHASYDHQSYPFQITVYERDYTAQDWLAGKIMYQIFPDRFARDRGFTPDRMRDGRHDQERLYHDDWDEDVDIHGKAETGYIACDFYGGSLRGIIEHLDQLERFGITALYLNPIFSARSNHRYDTADYLTVDPMLGDLKDFTDLIAEAKARGISVILDGVFSHTGADSIYFNRYGRFPNVGAYQTATGNVPSDYYGWYNIQKTGDEYRYDCWWGFPELPAVNENDLSFRDFILGEHGVVSTWLERGAAGFRLDVSDELPDRFLRSLRQRVKNSRADALIMGEVWEDASDKVSYGAYRDFLFGRTHDSVMGYPFRQAVLDFFSRRITSEQLRDKLETIRENYPPPAFALNMNLLSSHDVPRFITAVADGPEPVTREKQQPCHLSAEQKKLGRKLLLLAYGFALSYPGVPCIYYGDERLMEGYRDPFNRRTFPWKRPHESVETELEQLCALRNTHQVLQTGFIRWLPSPERVLRLRRFFSEGKDLLGRIGKGESEVLLSLNAGDSPYHDEILGLTVPAYALALRVGEMKTLIFTAGGAS